MMDPQAENTIQHMEPEKTPQKSEMNGEWTTGKCGEGRIKYTSISAGILELLQSLGNRRFGFGHRGRNNNEQLKGKMRERK